MTSKADVVSMLSLAASSEPEGEEDTTGTWRLIHDNDGDRIHTDEELFAVAARLAARTATPYAELLQRLLGIEVSEEQARTLFTRTIEHRRQMSAALGRLVHIRVAALDLLTSSPRVGEMRFVSRPIVVSASVLEKALEEARADALTGLPQRGHFVSLVRHELRQRRRRKVAVAFLDLDGMKRVNDQHGHARGDEALRALALVGREALRQGDVLARIGGDEFGLLLVDLAAEEAESVIGRLRERFEASTAALGTSFSAGIALANPDDTAEALIDRADSAMYRNKRERASTAPRG